MKLAEVVGLLDIKDALKLKYTQMAIVFEDNLDDNIVKTHTELSKDTGIPYDDWAKFLSITEISGWLNETMRLLSKAGEPCKLRYGEHQAVFDTQKGLRYRLDAHLNMR